MHLAFRLQLTSNSLSLYMCWRYLWNVLLMGDSLHSHSNNKGALMYISTLATACSFPPAGPAYCCRSTGVHPILSEPPSSAAKEHYFYLAASAKNTFA